MPISEVDRALLHRDSPEVGRIPRSDQATGWSDEGDTPLGGRDRCQQDLEKALSALDVGTGSRAGARVPGRSPWPSARLGRRIPPQRVHRLIGLPDGHEVPPPVGRRDRKILRRAPAPIWDVERLWGRPAVGAEVSSPEAHRRHLAATGPAGLGWASLAGGVEPGSWRHERYSCVGTTRKRNVSHEVARARRPGPRRWSGAIGRFVVRRSPRRRSMITRTPAHRMATSLR